MLIAGLIVLIVCFTLLIAVIFKRLVMNKNEWIIFGIVLISGLVMVAFGIVPPEEWDLYRHYELLDDMKRGGWDYIVSESIYTHLPIVNFLYAIVSVTEVYQLLPCLVVIICYSIAFYLLKDTMREGKGDSWFVAFAIFFNMALCPFLHMVSGVRNILAYAICALIFYLDIYEKINKILIYILYLATIFIHPSSIIVCCIRILIPILLKWKWLNVFVVMWSLVTDMLVIILLKIPIAFIQSVGWKLEDYLNNLEFSGHKMLLIKLFFLGSLLLLIEFYKKAMKLGKQDVLYRYLSSFQVVILFILGAFRVQFIADRLCYFIAFTAFPVLFCVYKGKETKVKYIFYIESICVFALLFIYQFLYFSTDLIG